ncbi:hypothetical protein AB3X94_37190 [Paraburkholderia sp. BR10923]|uniref:hypothetical protein n=1 Tax=Paraburkholderia sp. BR10923 TaxID=3236992 RepID=UPI0034CDB153
MKVRRLDHFGDWTFGQGLSNYADGSESTQQRVRTRLLSFLRDWFLDLTHGMPWLDDFERPGNLVDIERAARLTILQTVGVARLDDLILDLSEDRVLTMQVSIATTDDDTLDLTVVNNGPTNA